MIKMRSETLAAMTIEAFRKGIQEATAINRVDADRRIAESTKALLEENNRLKRDLSKLEQCLHSKEQVDCFPHVRIEQVRIVKGIRLLLPKEKADDLIFKLALGDVK